MEKRKGTKDNYKGDREKKARVAPGKNQAEKKARSKNQSSVGIPLLKSEEIALSPGINTNPNVEKNIRDERADCSDPITEKKEWGAGSAYEEGGLPRYAARSESSDVRRSDSFSVAPQAPSESAKNEECGGISGSENALSAQNIKENAGRSDLSTLSDARAPKKEKRKRQNLLKVDILTVTPDGDLPSRGPLSYRTLRVIAWFFFILAQVGVLLNLFGKFDAGIARKYKVVTVIFRVLSSTMTPLFLIASFACIINGSRKIQNMLLVYGLGALAIIGGCLFMYYRYILGIMEHVVGMDKKTASATIVSMASGIGSGYLAFNMLLDLFLCTLFLFFILYEPKGLSEKGLRAFRFGAAIPVLYETASFALKLFAGAGLIKLPLQLYPFLTTKPPLTFALFMMIAFYFGKQKKEFKTAGRTEEEYQAYLGTNFNSSRFSAYLNRCIFRIARVDILLQIALAILLTCVIPKSAATLKSVWSQLFDNGFGESVSLLLIVPFIKLFSYTRSYKDRRADLLLPILTFAVLALIYNEALYRLLLYLPGYLDGFMPGI